MTKLQDIIKRIKDTWAYSGVEGQINAAKRKGEYQPGWAPALPWSPGATGEAQPPSPNERVTKTLTEPTPSKLTDALLNKPMVNQPVKKTLQGVLTGSTPKSYPYGDIVRKYFKPEEADKFSQIIMGESSNMPNLFHVNSPLYQKGIVVKPEEVNATKKKYPSYIVISSRNEWNQLRKKYPSIDAGLTQMSTNPANASYLQNQGKTFYDLFSDPELAIKIASDLNYGRIPQTAPGLQNWVAFKNLSKNND